MSIVLASLKQQVYLKIRHNSLYWLKFYSFQEPFSCSYVRGLENIARRILGRCYHRNNRKMLEGYIPFR
jgi:hypothetical protein